MPEPGTLVLFVGASLVLLLTPGPAVLYIVARAVERGRAAGLVSALGMGAGTAVHVAAAVLGLSTILARSPLAFDVVKYLGAGYLIFLGARRLVEAHGPADARVGLRARSLRQVFVEGLLVNVTNPKTALFVLAFLPQFVGPSDRIRSQLLVLGFLLILLGLLTDAAYALLASSLGRHLLGRPDRRLPRFVSGSLLVGLGLAVVFAGSGQH